MFQKKIPFYCILFLLLFFSCKKAAKKEATHETAAGIVQHADGFRIQKLGDKYNLIIYNPYQNAVDYQQVILSNSNKNRYLKIPIQNIVVTSTTHIPMLELLEKEETLIGFPNTKYVSSTKTQERIKNGFVKEIGIDGYLNTEVLLALQPDVVVGYSVSGVDKSLENIKKNGVPVIYNGDWLETTPLGRAEWIKFFGLLYHQLPKADSIFNTIKNGYLEAKNLAKKTRQQPTVLSGAVMSKDIWNLPAGESYVAQFLKDANTHYLWENSKGKGSLHLSFESVFEKGKEADFWIAPGYFSSKKQLLESNKLYAEFKAFKNNNIYTPVTKKGNNGGVLYYELATVRPDLVLKDLIKITHPELLPHYQLTFFEQMQ